MACIHALKHAVQSTRRWRRARAQTVQSVARADRGTLSAILLLGMRLRSRRSRVPLGAESPALRPATGVGDAGDPAASGSALLSAATVGSSPLCSLTPGLLAANRRGFRRTAQKMQRRTSEGRRASRRGRCVRARLPRQRQPRGCVRSSRTRRTWGRRCTSPGGGRLDALVAVEGGVEHEHFRVASGSPREQEKIRQVAGFVADRARRSGRSRTPAGGGHLGLPVAHRASSLVVPAPQARDFVAAAVARRRATRSSWWSIPRGAADARAPQSLRRSREALPAGAPPSPDRLVHDGRRSARARRP